MIPYVDLAKRTRGQKEELLAAVERVLDHGKFILGPEVEEFEAAFARLCGGAHAVGMNSGTDALQLALTALGIGPGDEVITQPNSFVASASAVVLAGARPIFVDVGSDYLIDPLKIERAITSRTRAILPVHLTGRPCNMRAINEIAKRHGLRVIEDAAQAVGASFDGKPVGSLSDVGCFSMHPLKNLNACGDAGVAVTGDAAIAERLRLLRNIGLKTRDDCTEFAGNSRLDTLQAAMLLVKMQTLEDVTQARRANADLYRRLLADVPAVRLPAPDVEEYSVYHTFVVRAQRRDELRAYLRDMGIGTTIHYPVPIHLSAAAKDLGYKRGDFPEVELQADEIVSLPIQETLTPDEIDTVVAAIRKFYR